MRIIHDEVIENIDKLTNKRAKTALEKGIDSAHLSKKLVAIVQDLELGLEPKDLAYSLEPNDDFLAYLDELNFKSFKNKLKTNSTAIVEKADTYVKFDTIKEEAKWSKVVDLIVSHDSLFIDCIFREESYHSLNPFCFALSVGEKNFIVYPEEIKPFTEIVKDILSSDSTLIVSNNIKPILCAAYEAGIDVKNKMFDSSQAHFVLNADKKHDLGTIVEEILREKVSINLL